MCINYGRNCSKCKFNCFIWLSFRVRSSVFILLKKLVSENAYCPLKVDWGYVKFIDAHDIYWWVVKRRMYFDLTLGKARFIDFINTVFSLLLVEPEYQFARRVLLFNQKMWKKHASFYVSMIIDIWIHKSLHRSGHQSVLCTKTINSIKFIWKRSWKGKLKAKPHTWFKIHEPFAISFFALANVRRWCPCRCLWCDVFYT